MARMLRATLLWRCPECCRGPLFERGYRIRATCAICGVRFERSDGAGSGAMWIAQMLGTALGFGIGGLLWMHWGSAASLTWWIAGTACISILATYRHCQAWWTWLLWATGMVFADRDDLSRRREVRELQRAWHAHASAWPRAVRRVRSR